MSREDTARVFKAFCDENRLEIIELLKKGEMCANDILKNVDIVQSTLSHHMKILCESGIIVSRKSGKMTLYSVSPDGINIASDILNTYKDAKIPNLQENKTEPVKRPSKKVTAKTVKEVAVKPAPEPVWDDSTDDDDNWTKMVTFID